MSDDVSVWFSFVYLPVVVFDLAFTSAHSTAESAAFPHLSGTDTPTASLDTAAVAVAFGATAL